MRKTAKQVETDIISLIKNSALAGYVNGQVYRAGLRPRGSQKEDICVNFLTGIPSEVQTGIVTINIYVPDIHPYADGTFVENGRRVAQIEAKTQEFVESLDASKSGYLFSQDATINSTEDENIHQHFVVVRLVFKFIE